MSWLGQSIAGLRRIRGTNIGAERAPSSDYDATRIDTVLGCVTDLDRLPRYQHGMVRRFAGDIDRVLTETRRVLGDDGRAVFVTANSLL